MPDAAADYPFVVAIGGSAGALDAMIELLAEVPAGLPVPIVLALHSMPDARLIRPLELKLPHDMHEITEGETLRPGHLHVAPAARHVFFRNDTLHLSDPVEDSGFRPSIDALFMTLATTWGDRAIGVVLSGLLQDGMRGAQVLYDLGGRTLVQDPDYADYDEMPLAVIRNDHPDRILPAADLGRWITRVVEAAA